MSSTDFKTKTAREALQECLRRPIAFYALLARIGGGTCAGVFLSQAYYWSHRTKHAGGWFYKSQTEWTAETCLSRTEQETVRKKLKSRGLLQERKIGNPQRLWFRIEEEAIASAIAIDDTPAASNRNAESLHAGKAHARNLLAQKLHPDTAENPHPEVAGIPHPLKKHKLPESPTETTSLVLFASADQTNNEVVIFLPLNDKTEHAVTEVEVSEWMSLYPAIDVPQQLRNMRGWLLGNPKRRKTKSGIGRFVTNWLADKQNNAGDLIRGTNQNNYRSSGAFHSGQSYERVPDSEM